MIAPSTSQPTPAQNWTGPIIGLVLGALLFGTGFWLGQRSVPKSNPTPAVVASHPQWSPPPANAPVYPMPAPNSPANASPEMKEFLQNRATLNARMNELRAQETNGAPTPQALKQFQQQNADLLKRQSELAQDLAQQQSPQQAQNPLPTPPPLQIPANASPQMKAYLTARDQLMRDQITFMNEHRSDDPAKRQAAMKTWREQNAPRFAQLQQMTASLQSTSPAQPSSSPPTAAKK